MKSFGVTPRWAARYGPPVLVFAAVVAAWEAYVRLRNVPAYILPSPSLVLETLFTDRATLFPALLVTLKTTFAALAAAVIGGVGLAILFTQWKWVERSLLPFAIVLQVTPIIAIAPLLLIYLEAPAAVLVCAFLVAFFPILSNTALGLASADRNLVDLFKLYRATPISFDHSAGLRQGRQYRRLCPTNPALERLVQDHCRNPRRFLRGVRQRVEPAGEFRQSSRLRSRPKGSIIFGPFAETEFYANIGQGFHSNDLRGVTIKVQPTDPINRLLPATFLVQTQGAEIGIRTKAIEGLNSAVALFGLDAASENIFFPEMPETPSRAGRPAASALNGPTITGLDPGLNSKPTWP